MQTQKFFKTPAGIAVLYGLLLISMALSIRIGSTYLNAQDFFGGLFFRDGFEKEALIVYVVRMPRVFAAVLAGAGLALSGVLLQSVTGNELAGPNIIGVNSGAGLAVILLLYLVPSAVLSIPFAAFAGAFLATLFIVAIAGKVKGGRSTVILAGIAVTAIFNAGISFISLLDTDVLAAYNYFSVGALSGVRLEKLLVPACIILPAFSASMVLHRRIDTLCLGDGVAVSLGVRVKQLRVACLIFASAAAAAVVSFAGLLGFVGLVVPHIARRLCGSTAGYLIHVSVLCGAILVVWADLLGRALAAPSEIPVGIIMALIGAPFFFWLLLRRDRDARI